MLTLSRSERTELEHQARADFSRADSARHAQLILLLADGCTWAEIRQRLGCSDSYIARWSKRFAAERLAGLYARHAGRERYKVTDRLEKRVLNWTTQHRPSDGSRHWSSRKLAAELGGTISHMTVARIWARHGIKPHHATGDPDFNAAESDIIGLYLHKPQHAAAFSVQESTRSPTATPPGPTPPRHAEAPRDVLKRNGALELYAALKGRTEALTARPHGRGTSAEFAAFLADISAHLPQGRLVHVITDNNSVRRTRVITMLLADHPRLHLHFTATYPAWLEQVERSLARIEHDTSQCGLRKTVPDLTRKLTRQIQQHVQRSAPVKWKSNNP